MKLDALISTAGARGLLVFCALVLHQLPSTRAQNAEDVAARLAAHIVTDKDYARSVFYSWTSPAQIAALRTSKTLLVATAATGGGRPSPFIRMLSERVEQRQPGHEVAALLLNHPSLSRRRYAWTSPFATVLGLGERSYGTELMKVSLRPNALIVRFAPNSEPPFAFVNLKGEAVAVNEVMATPERIGAVYHVRTRGPSDFVPFREYILCNEGMVESFSIATDEIRARLVEETELLRALRPHFSTLSSSDQSRSAVPAWSEAPVAASLVAKWHAAQAFDNRKYRPTAKNLDRIIAGLATYGGSGPPLIYHPTPTK